MGIGCRGKAGFALLGLIQLHDSEDAVVGEIQQSIAQRFIDLGGGSLDKIHEAVVLMGDLDSGGDDAVIAKLLIELGEGIAVICVFGFEGIAHFNLDVIKALNIIHEVTSL